MKLFTVKGSEETAKMHLSDWSCTEMTFQSYELSWFLNLKLI